jgi:hypothetical protein
MHLKSNILVSKTDISLFDTETRGETYGKVNGRLY